jgi:hypothetical protein
MRTAKEISFLGLKLKFGKKKKELGYCSNLFFKSVRLRMSVFSNH